MGRISFNPTAKSIFLRLKVGSINTDTTRDILVALDTGASYHDSDRSGYGLGV